MPGLFRLILGKVVLADTAKGAYKIFGQIGKGSAGSNAVIGVAQFLVVDPTAYIAYIFHKITSVYNRLSKSGRATFL